MTDRTEKWTANTYVAEGSIIYPTNPNGFYYIAIQGGTTKASTEGYSASYEPAWPEVKSVMDNYLIWRPLPHDPNPSVEEWKPNTLYHLGDKVYPASGNLQGLYSYIVNRIIAEPDWPIEKDAVIEDGTVIWQCKISTQQFIPQELSTDELLEEFYRLVDYLLNSNVVTLNDTLYKFKDRSKIQVEALQSYITEQGYEYIVNVLSLTKDQLETLTEYLNLIHFLKGTRRGLELVLDLLGIVADITEWWEEDPKEEPHTFRMELEFNLGNIRRDTVTRLTEFTTHYVFPKLKSIIINYESEIASMQVSLAGGVDQEFNIDSGNAISIAVHTHAHIETTLFAYTLLPDARILSPFGKILILPGDVALALP